MTASAVWLDFETTGLIPEKHRVLEIAAVAVNSKLSRCDSIEQVFAHNGEGLDDFIIRMHTKNKLLSECAVSKVDPIDFDYRLAKFFHQWSPDDLVILAGDSVHFDKGFLKENFPISYRLCSHRMLDVSSVHLAMKLFGGGFPPKLDDTAHRAATDIVASTEKLKALLGLNKIRDLEEMVKTRDATIERLQKEVPNVLSQRPR